VQRHHPRSPPQDRTQSPKLDTIPQDQEQRVKHLLAWRHSPKKISPSPFARKLKYGYIDSRLDPPQELKKNTKISVKTQNTVNSRSMTLSAVIGYCCIRHRGPRSALHVEVGITRVEKGYLTLPNPTQRVPTSSTIPPLTTISNICHAVPGQSPIQTIPVPLSGSSLSLITPTIPTHLPSDSISPWPNSAPSSPNKK
jgi:hypothetical protein